MSTFDSAPNVSWEMCHTSRVRVSPQHVTYRDWEKGLPEPEFQKTIYQKKRIRNSRSFEGVLLIITQKT